MFRGETILRFDDDLVFEKEGRAIVSDFVIRELQSVFFTNCGDAVFDFLRNKESGFAVEMSEGLEFGIGNHFQFSEGLFFTAADVGLV